MNNKFQVESLLYVEDEKNIQTELADVLGDYCKNLYLADNGKQGLELYKQHKPQIVVSDIMMPVMDGIEMAKEIKELSGEAKIIFTTAFSDYDYLQQAIELQVDGYILKPILLDKFEQKLQSIIQNIKNKEELEEKELMLIQQSKLSAMGEMMTNIAHQWRQPLATISSTAIAAQTKVMLQGSIKNEEVIECAKYIQTQTSYLSQTIEDFTNFFIPYKSDSTFKVSEFINRCINLVKASFENSNIDLITKIDSDIEAVGDPNQLTQAIINILNNSRDAFENAKNTQKKLVFLISIMKNDEGCIVITIGDNAGGIPEDIIDKIFEPYFTTKFKSQGTGLGLYITHTIITKNLKGCISVKNEIIEHEGNSFKGAQFVIKIPNKQNQTIDNCV